MPEVKLVVDDLTTVETLLDSLEHLLDELFFSSVEGLDAKRLFSFILEASDVFSVFFLDNSKLFETVLVTMLWFKLGDLDFLVFFSEETSETIGDVTDEPVLGFDFFDFSSEETTGIFVITDEPFFLLIFSSTDSKVELFDDALLR